MSLSKPFRLQELPRLAFENVLHQMYPLYLFELSNIPSTNLLNRMKNASLASFCDIEIRYNSSVISITMRNGDKFKWRVYQEDETEVMNGEWFCNQFYGECLLERGEGPSYRKLSDTMKLEVFKCSANDTMCSILRKTDEEPPKHPLFSQLLCKFPCPIRNLFLTSTSKQGIALQKYMFNWKSVKQCENLRIICALGNDFLDFLERIEVRNEVDIDYCQQTRRESTRFCNYWVKDYKTLKLYGVQNYTGYALNHRSNHEHLTLCGVNLRSTHLNEYLQNWQNGGHCQLKTLYYCGNYGLDLPLILENLRLERSMPKESPRFVKCSKVYIDTTIQSESHYQTVLIKNQQGTRATVLIRRESLYFAIWEEPYQIAIPKGHRMVRTKYMDSETDPIYELCPMIPEVFRNEEYVQRDLKEFQSNLQFTRMHLID